MTTTHPQVLITNGTLVNPLNNNHMKKVDILIQDGSIVEVGTSISSDTAFVINVDGAYICSGWIDIGAYCGEPGDEVHETFRSLSDAATAGGYTGVAIFSNRVRPFDNRHIISDTQNQSGDHVRLLPVPALTKDLKGEELSEMLDLAKVTVANFTDGLHAIDNNALLYKSMEYVNQCNGRITTIPGKARGLKNGLVNESKVSAGMGLPGIPGQEEVSTLANHLSLASYAQSRYCAHALSHRDSLDLIRSEKDRGLDVMASVSAIHLLSTESDVSDFDENYKILPPLRSEVDRVTLISGLKDKTLDYVTSYHIPVTSDQKQRDFGESPFGAIGLETAFYSISTAVEGVDAESINRWLSIGPRKALGIDLPSIQPQEKADFTLFNLHKKTTWDVGQSKSLSSNSPFHNHTFRGQILGSVCGQSVYLAGQST